MNKINNKIKLFFSDKCNIKKVGIISSIILILALVIIPSSFAQTTPIKSVEIPSTTLSYTNNEEGSWNITKSAKWISKGKARITLEVDSVINANNMYADVILVLDTSGSMNGERLDKVKSDTTNLINKIIPKGNNVALITFSNSSTIVSDFTSDSETLITHINNLEAIGNTNYYQALSNVDTILKNYKFSDTRDCVVLFLTDGYPNIDSPNEIGQYNYLKTTYPSLTINGIQYEMGNKPLEPLKAISDNQHIAYVSDLEQFLYKAAVSPIEYKKFEITDYIEDEYFSVDSIDSIIASTGNIKLENNKVTWTLENYRTGSAQKLTIDINLKNELIGVGGVYPTNKNLSVEYEIRDTSAVETSKLTPIISDNYQVIYDGNSPNDCIVSKIPKSSNVSIFDTVYISDEEAFCEGYQFKGWELVSSEIEKVNSKYFVMPEDNVILRATWSRLSTTKAMEGKVAKVQNLYEMMADNSVPDNIQSEFVTSSTGINFSQISSNTNGKGIYQAVKTEGEDTPIYYYRGDVDNNIIFANFCWKIVRTTETKGVKLIYNGIPNEDGSCTAIGQDATIGNSSFNSNANSIAYNGYMYGDAYTIQFMNTSIVGFGGKTAKTQKNQSTTNYIYSSQITYNEETGLYTLVDGENRNWSDTYSIDTGNQYLYTCFSETKNTCSTVGYVVESNNVDIINYVDFINGETADEILNKEIVFGNDVLYDDTTGNYLLQNTYTTIIRDWEENKEIVSGPNGYHYTCINESGVCSTVKYISYIINAGARSYGTIRHINLSNGVTIEEALKKMTTEPEYNNESNVKKNIDTWYEKNIIGYSDNLENTIWCNDMEVGTYAGWDRNELATGYLYYDKYYDITINYTPTFTCTNTNNAYTLKIENAGTEGYGNNALKYPVALLTADEVMFAGGRNAGNSTYYLNSGTSWQTLSPYRYGGNNYRIIGYAVKNDGVLADYYSYTSTGIRPSISLKSGIRSIDGDGSQSNPFVVESKIDVEVTYDANGGQFPTGTTNYVKYKLGSYGDTKTEIGTYITPTHPDENMEFAGWYTAPTCPDNKEFNFSIAEKTNLVYAKWIDKRPTQAIYSTTNNSLNFVNDNTEYSVGDIYKDAEGNELTVTKVYTDFEETEYTEKTIPWFELKDSVTNIVIRDEINPISTAYWFYNFRKVSTIDVSKINTANVKKMNHTFGYTGYNATSFEITGLDKWYTSQAINLNNMFDNTGYNATTWDIGDISNWDTSNVTNMSRVFYRASNKAQKFTIDVSNWNTSNVTNMTGMFDGAGYQSKDWQIGNLTNWDTSKVTNMSYMFQGAGYNAETFNIGNINEWDVSKVTDMRSIFTNMGHSTKNFELDIGKWDTSKVTNMANMFDGTGYNATNFTIKGIETLNTSKVTNMGSMFANYAHSMENFELDITNFDTSNVTNMSSMFNGIGYSAESFIIKGLEKINTENVTSMSYMFANYAYSMENFELDITTLDTSKVTNMSGMFNGAAHNATTINIKGLDVINTTNVTDMNQMFANFAYSIENFELDLGVLKTPQLTNIAGMFNGAGHSAKTFIIKGFDKFNTKNVTNMSSMFTNVCYSIENFELDITGLNTESVTNMSSMFNNAGYSATTFTIKGLDTIDTSNVTNMSMMFSNIAPTAQSVILDLSKFNTEKVTNMNKTFHKAANNVVEFYLDLSSWNVSSVTDMAMMFFETAYNSQKFNLTGLDNWNTTNLTTIDSMFEKSGYNATEWSVGNLSNWNTSNVISMYDSFVYAGYKAAKFNLGDLSSWDTSKVTDMGYMFHNAGISATEWNIGNIRNWNTSNVTNMNSMFNGAGKNATYNLDLSNWNVDKVTIYTNFNLGVESKITLPIWVN